MLHHHAEKAPLRRNVELEEIAAANATHGRGTVAGLADLRFVRACIKESIASAATSSRPPARRRGSSASSS